MTWGVDTAPSVLRRALADFAQRSPATQADIDRVMRSLAEHDDWYVPIRYADRFLRQTVFHQTLAFPGVPPNGVLTVFTDRESALRAEGQPIGPYGGPVAGGRLMTTLDPGLTSLVVNPASPPDHQWYIAAGGFEIAGHWAAAVAAERALAARNGGPPPARELRAHRAYQLLLDRAENALIEIRVPSVDGTLAVGFTGPDRAEEFLDRLPPGPRANAALVLAEGPELFDMMCELDLAGLVLNAGSPHQAVLFRADLRQIAAA
ncbi:MAG: hypothetical protein ACM30G_09100 [Micromonosporaceae bacterium]